MDEWSQLPLQGWSDMERWMTAMADQFVIEQTSGGVSVPGTSSGGYTVPISPAQDNTRNPGVGMEAQVPSGMYAWQPRDGMHVGSSYETHLQPAGMGSPVYSRCQASAGSEGRASSLTKLPECTNISVPDESSHSRIVADGQCNRAEKLSKSKPSIYF